MTEHDAGAGRSGRRLTWRPRRTGRPGRLGRLGRSGRSDAEPAGRLEPIGDPLSEPDIAPEHDSLTVDDAPIDKPSESDARWA
jgi:hypothetical protein